jgi:hypothetical protein
MLPGNGSKNTLRGRIPVAEKLGYSDFKASSGCLTRFKERHNQSQHNVCGESADVPVVTVSSWKERLGAITAGCKLQDI